MTERHDDPAGNGRRMSTGEFRAAPDISASTAQFQAFAEDRPEVTRTWDAGAPGRSPAKVAMLAVGGLVLVAIIAILVATLG
jgi:cytochrome b